MATDACRGGPLGPPSSVEEPGRTQRSAPASAIILIVALSCLGGCVKQKTTLNPPPTPPNPQPKMASDMNVRIQTLERLSDNYARLSKQLPGPNPSTHRKLMAEVFAKLEELLPMLEGPNPGAEFRQQMEIIGDAHAQLASGAMDLSPEPT